MDEPAAPTDRSGAPSEYGLGHRILEDRHAAKPVGGEVEAGYGIGNRSLSNHQVYVPGLTGAPPTDRSSSGRAAGSRRKGQEDRFSLNDGLDDGQKTNKEDTARMRQAAAARMKSRPF